MSVQVSETHLGFNSNLFMLTIKILGANVRSWQSLLQECVFVLVCDDSDEVSVAAQEFLEGFLLLGEKQLIEREIAEIINRLVFCDSIGFFSLMDSLTLSYFATG